MSTADGVERLPGQFVSGNYHAVLGVPMSLGRGFAAEQDRGAASLIAVIIALAAGFVPARRAAAVDPVTVLRND